MNTLQSISLLSDLIDDSHPAEDSNNPIRRSLKNLLYLVEESYVHVGWPESQDLMEEEWFEEEAVLDLDEGSAYFIPLHRMHDRYNNILD